MLDIQIIKKKNYLYGCSLFFYFIWAPWPCHSPLRRPSLSNICKLSISSLTSTHPFVHQHVYSWHDSHCGTSRGCWRRRVAGCCEFPRWQHVKGRQTQRNKKCPNSIAVQRLGSWYEMSTGGIILDMCSGGTHKSPHPGDGWSTFQRNKHALFSIADSQRQANIKTRQIKDVQSNSVTSCRQIWRTLGLFCLWHCMLSVALSY